MSSQIIPIVIWQMLHAEQIKGRTISSVFLRCSLLTFRLGFYRNGFLLLLTVTKCHDSVTVHLLSLFVAGEYCLKAQESLKVDARFGDDSSRGLVLINRILVVVKKHDSSDSFSL